MDKIWYENPKVLIDHYDEIFPYKYSKMNTGVKKMNSYMRFIIIIFLIMLTFVRKHRLIILLGLITVIIASVVIWERKMFNFGKSGFVNVIDDPVHSKGVPTIALATTPLVSHIQPQSINKSIIDDIEGTMSSADPASVLHVPPYGHLRSEYPHYSDEISRGDTRNNIFTSYDINIKEDNMKDINEHFGGGASHHLRNIPY